MKEYVLDLFSIGGRVAIGRTLAVIELTKMVVAVVSRYEDEEAEFL